jgi:hypothetical protein
MDSNSLQRILFRPLQIIRPESDLLSSNVKLCSINWMMGREIIVIHKIVSSQLIPLQMLEEMEKRCKCHIEFAICKTARLS